MRVLQKNLNDASNQIGSSNEAYNELKARVKVVAAELMERRIECRELKSHLDDQTGENEGLRDKITHMEVHGMDKDQSTTERQQELNDIWTGSKNWPRRKPGLTTNDKREEAGTVLCLTKEEQKKAIDALDQSGGVIDTISSSMLTNFTWS